MADARAAEARRAHRSAAEALERARVHREKRDRAIRELRKEGWSYGRIAREVGCSPELVAVIWRQR